MYAHAAFGWLLAHVSHHIRLVHFGATCPCQTAVVTRDVRLLSSEVRGSLYVMLLLLMSLVVVTGMHIYTHTCSEASDTRELASTTLMELSYRMRGALRRILRLAPIVRAR